MQDIKTISKLSDGAVTTTILRAVENYVKPGLIAAILKTNHDLVPVLGLNSPDATAGRLYKAAKLLFPGFDSYLNKLTREKLSAYDRFVFMYQSPLKKTELPIYLPVISDWLDGGYQLELAKKLELYYNDKPLNNKKTWTLVERSVNLWLKDNRHLKTGKSLSWEGADGFLKI